MKANAVVRINPATNAVEGRTAVGTGPFVVNEAFGDLWVPSFGARDVWRVQAP
jgi:hypothetical protein